jgi:hypothetical protein
MENQKIFVRIATIEDIKYVNEIITETERSAMARGTGISKRSPLIVMQKMRDGKAVIALTNTGNWVGFAYMEIWDDGNFVSNSGLIVAPTFRNLGIAKSIKNKVFEMARWICPNAKIFSITSGSTVMNMNTQLGFRPVSFEAITKDEKFWDGCKSCVNYAILESKKRGNCLCTAMLFDPQLPLAMHQAEKPILHYNLAKVI